MTALGFPPMPWQQYTLDVALEVNDAGGWAYQTVVETVPRQSGKTAKKVAIHCHRCLIARDPRRGLAGVARTWYTAQTRQHARDQWLDAVGILRRSPLRPTLQVRESNGSEAVTFPTGATYRPFAPGEGALDGWANELVDVDEAWKFDAAKGAALEASYVPTFTTTGGQAWITSTAGTAESEWLLGWRDLGRANVDAGRTGPVAYFEWSLPDDEVAAVEQGIAPEADDADRAHALATVLAHHPAAGRTLNLDALANALELATRDPAKGPGDFLRAYGNRFTAVAERVIPLAAWEACEATLSPPPAGHVALGFEVALDRADAAIVAAWREVDEGPVQVDVIDARPGTSWLAPRVAELAAKWRPSSIGYDTLGPSLDVADELRRKGIKLEPMTTQDYLAACPAFLADVVAGRVAHPGAAVLDAAVAGAGKRTVGDRWVWGRQRSAGSIAALGAATVARWRFDHRPVRRKATIRSGKPAA